MFGPGEWAQPDGARGVADRIVRAVLGAAAPEPAVERHWPANLIGDRPTTLIAMGKGAAGMASAALPLLPGLERGVVVCPPDHVGRVPTGGDRLRVMPADHPLPTLRNVAAADEVERVAASARPDGVLVVLISGGASAQVTAPAHGLLLDHVTAVSGDLLRSGATINQLNCVRKHIDRLKGGRLAALAAGVPAVALVLSDVLRDRLDVVSSGPMHPDPTTYTDARRVLESFGLTARHPEIARLLARGAAGELPDTPKPGAAIFRSVATRVIGSNALAVRAARDSLKASGFTIIQTRRLVEGPAARAGDDLGAAVAELAPGQAIVWGGETTVDVGPATGVGGRNQELALAAAIRIAGSEGLHVMSLATDGVDGPTDAAGALVGGTTARALRRAGIDAHRALADHDSHTALGRVNALIRLGPTGTNINDIAAAWRTD